MVLSFWNNINPKINYSHSQQFQDPPQKLFAKMIILTSFLVLFFLTWLQWGFFRLFFLLFSPLVFLSLHPFPFFFFNKMVNLLGTCISFQTSHAPCTLYIVICFSTTFNGCFYLLIFMNSCVTLKQNKQVNTNCIK